tara:strand:- start:453 stop:644 length:192 start_codon:yes stop_codon:yes gene_type:complete
MQSNRGGFDKTGGINMGHDIRVTVEINAEVDVVEDLMDMTLRDYIKEYVLRNIDDHDIHVEDA